MINKNANVKRQKAQGTWYNGVLCIVHGIRGRKDVYNTIISQRSIATNLCPKQNENTTELSIRKTKFEKPKTCANFKMDFQV